jgi:hypothetical protein
MAALGRDPGEAQVNECYGDVTTTTVNRIVFRLAKDTPLTPNLFAML